MLNPDIKFAKSKGIDLPLMYVYLAGRIAGECIDKCLEWRQQIINHYKNYKPICVGGSLSAKDGKVLVGYESYPISFLDALNSKESDSIDKKGLTSCIPPNLIYDKDILSVKRADVVVAMMDDYMEEGIEDLLDVIGQQRCTEENIEGVILDHYNLKGEFAPNHEVNFKEAFYKLQSKILERRPNWGTDYEVSLSMYLGKPTILIAGNERQKEMLEKHPFLRRASVIVGSVEELLEKKWLNILYKSISGAIY